MAPNRGIAPLAQGSDFCYFARELCVAPGASRAAAPNKTLGPARVAHSASFLTGAGGFLQQFIYRYTGLRLTENGVAPKFKPILPSSIRKLTVHNVHSRGKRYDVIVEGDSRRMIERE
jgi:hypothetical protein